MGENLEQKLLNSQQELQELIDKNKLEKIINDQKEIALRIIDSNRVMKAKLNQLDTWITQTFKYSEPPPGEDYVNINKALNLYKSEYKQDFEGIIAWLKDPNDNYKEYFFKKTAEGHFIYYKFFLIV